MQYHQMTKKQIFEEMELARHWLINHLYQITMNDAFTTQFKRTTQTVDDLQQMELRLEQLRAEE